jgi:hypothetical protein
VDRRSLPLGAVDPETPGHRGRLGALGRGIGGNFPDRGRHTVYYDFSGFHPRYKTLPYASPDATTLAQRMVRTFFGRRQCTSSPSVVSITGPSSR